MNRNHAKSNETITIVLAITYLAILWTVTFVDGNDGLWKMLDKTLDVGFFWSQELGKIAKYLDHRLAEQWVPALIKAFLHLEALSSKVLDSMGQIMLQIVSLTFYFLCELADKAVVFATRVLDKTVQLIQLTVTILLHIFEPNGSNKVAFAIWAFICARIIDRVVENREDLESLMLISAKLIFDTIKILLMGLTEISTFLIQVAIAYGVLMAIQHFQQPMIKSLESFLSFKPF